MSRRAGRLPSSDSPWLATRLGAENAPRAVLFDCWNTLFYYNARSTRSSRAVAAVAHSAPLSRLARRIEHASMRQPASTADIAARLVLAEFRVPAASVLVMATSRILRRVSGRPSAFPGALETLIELRNRGFILAMVTNTTEIALEMLRASFPIDSLFVAVITSYETQSLKPEESIFKAALACLGVEPCDVVMVGDSLANDIRGAEAVGIRGLLVDRTGSVTSYPARVHKLSELLDVLGRPPTDVRCTEATPLT